MQELADQLIDVVELRRDRVADRDMGDLLVIGKHNLGRGANDAIEADHIGGVIGHHADACIALTRCRLLECQHRSRKSEG